MGPEANADDSLNNLVGGILEASTVSNLVKRYEGLTQGSTPHPNLTGGSVSPASTAPTDNNDNNNDNNNGKVAEDHRTIALAHVDTAWATFEPTGVVATAFVSPLDKSAVSSAVADTTWETIESTASPLDHSLANGIASTLACGVPSVPEKILNDSDDVKINHRVRITVHRQDSDLAPTMIHHRARIPVIASPTSSMPQDDVDISYTELNESTEVVAKGDINEDARDVIDDADLPKVRSSTNDKCINKPSVLFRFPLSKIRRSKNQQVPAPGTHDEKPEIPSEQMNEELLVQVAELVDELNDDALTPPMSILRAAKILERYPGEEAKLVASLKRKVEKKSASTCTEKSTIDSKTMRNMALLDLTSLTDATEEMPSPHASPASESTNRVSASTAFDDVVEGVQGREKAIENLLQAFENVEGSDRARDLDDSTLRDAINGDIESVAVNTSAPMSKAVSEEVGVEVDLTTELGKSAEVEEQVDVGISDEGVEIYFDVGDDDALANEISVKLELYMRLEAIYGKVEYEEHAQRRLQVVLDRFGGREGIVLLALRRQMECNAVEEGGEIIDKDVSTGDNEPASQDSFGDIANESKSETARLTTKLKGFVKSKSIRKKKGCSIEEQSGPSSSHGALNRIPTSTGHSGDDLYDADMSADLDAYMYSTSMYPLK